MGSLCCSGEHAVLDVSSDVRRTGNNSHRYGVGVSGVGHDNLRSQSDAFPTVHAEAGSNQEVISGSQVPTHPSFAFPSKAELRHDGSGSSESLGASPKPRKLADESPEAAEALSRQKFDEEKRRKKEARRRARMSNSTGGSLEDGFLSKITEVEADVQYRYSFQVLGNCSKDIVTAVCGSEAAQALDRAPQNGAMDASPSMAASGTESQQGDNSGPPPGELSPLSAPSVKPFADKYRCLCYLGGQGDKVKLAKLVFSPGPLPGALRACCSRLDAANTTIVFAFLVDDMEVFQSQVQAALDSVIDAGYIQPHLKPSWVALFVTSADAHLASQSAYEEEVLELEQMLGDNLPKVGPVPLHDANRLYSVLAQIASQNLTNNQHMSDDNNMCEGIEEADEDYSSRDGSKFGGYAAEGRRAK